MPNDQSTELARRLRLALTVDDKRAADDPQKLPTALRKDVTDDLQSLDNADADTGTTEGDRTEAAGTLRKAFAELERQLRGSYRFLGAIDETAITDEERAGVFEAYLWKAGQLGRFDDGRCVALAKQAAKVQAEGAVPEAWRYPAVRLARIVAQLGIVESQQDAATGGSRQTANAVRDAAQDLAATTLSRVRFWYCCATRDADRTPELARIEYQPRRDYGTVGEGKKAPAPAPSTPKVPVPV